MGPTQRPDALRSAGRAARASVMLPSTLARCAVGQRAGVAGERWLATAGSPAAGARADTPPVAREAASRARGGALGPRTAAGETLVFCHFMRVECASGQVRWWVLVMVVRA